MKYRYDEFNHNKFESHRLAIDLIDNNAKVLDIGCATGYFAKELSKKNCETWGVDCDEVAVKKASKYCKKVIARNVDEVKTLPFPKNYFDSVFPCDLKPNFLYNLP